VGIVLDAVGSLHGAAELAAFAASSREEANTPVIDQVGWQLLHLKSNGFCGQLYLASYWSAPAFSELK